MQSSEWTPDRLQNRIRDHLRWVAALRGIEISEAPPPGPVCPVQPRHWFVRVLRKCVLSTPFAGPVLMKILRGVKARLRRTVSSPGL
jgi:hypothetical protein